MSFEKLQGDPVRKLQIFMPLMIIFQITNLCAEENVPPVLTEMLEYRINQQDAATLCLEKGMRLPTARELALVAQSMGALGISETKRDGYYLIQGTDKEGRPDYFYYSHKGYIRPDIINENSFAAYWMWSSSTHPEDSRYAYRFSGHMGLISYAYPDLENFYDSVRCVVSPY
jgi:hypothetical protein